MIQRTKDRPTLQMSGCMLYDLPSRRSGDK